MAALALGISGRLEEGEALQAWVLGSATGLQWQALVGGNWVNVGVANSQTYTVPAGASGTAYRLVGTSAEGTWYSEPTGAATVDTRKSNAPVLAGASQSSLATEDVTDMSLFHWLTVTDADKANYGGGSLLLQNSNSVLHGGDGNDAMSIRFGGTQAGQFSYDAATREVRYAFTNGNAVTVGTVDAVLNGNGTDLKVVFTTNATAAVVNALTDNLRFSNHDDSPVPARLFTLRITDASGASAQRVTSVSIENTPDAPVIISSASATVDENQLAVLTVAATDPDRESGEPQGISYSLAAGAGDADNGRFEIDAVTGALRFAVAPDYEDPQHGSSYSLRVRATDSAGSTVEQVVTVAVRNVNEAPVAPDWRAFTQEDALAVSFLPQFTDPDAGDVLTVTYDATGTLGNVSFDGSRFTYDAAGNFQQLGEYSFGTDTFAYTVTDAAGLSTTSTVTVVIRGVNDAASITGTSTAALQEDVGVDFAGQLNTSGKLEVSDIDDGEATFLPAVGLGSANLGRFFIAGDGRWTYQADNGALQSLAAGQTLVDSFTATSFDGSATQQLQVTITGTNDAALIGGTANADVYEDANLVDGFLVASGVLSIADLDAEQAHFVAQAETIGDLFYGIFSVDENGAWTYRLDNSSPYAQVLADGATAIDSFTVASADGSATQTVSVTVHGASDPAVITGTTELALTEDVAVVNGELKAVGRVTVTDPDFWESQLVSQMGVAGSGGYGTFNVFEQGAWVYRVNNSLAQVQSLAQGETLTDTLVVTSKDGSASRTLTVTITGTNDAPVIDPLQGVTGVVTESGSDGTGPLAGIPVASGVLAAGDIDGDTLAWAAGAGGQYGQFQIDAATGAWTYALDNAAASTQALAQGETAIDNFTVTLSDGHGGTAQQQVQVTVHGTNDAPQFVGGDTQGTVTESSPNGKLVLGQGVGGGIYGITADAQGRLLIVGESGSPGGSLWRLNEDGSADTSFGYGGSVAMGSSTAFSQVAVDSAGRYVLGGQVYNAATGSTDLGLSRYLQDGTLDTSFGAGGVVSIDFGGYDYATQILAGQDGKLFVVGDVQPDPQGNMVLGLMRFGADGSLDAGFGNGGKMVFAPTSHSVIVNFQATLDAQGRIVIWGTLYSPEEGSSGPYVQMTRLLPDGTADASFGEQGVVAFPLDGWYANKGSGLVMDDAGGLVLGWGAYPGPAGYHANLTRFDANGTLDTSFGGDGTVETGLVMQYGGTFELARDAQGKLLVAPWTSDPAGGMQDFKLARFNADGTVDTSFGTGGVVTTEMGSDDHGEHLIVGADGKIVLAGNTAFITGNAAAIARYNADGSLDLTFGGPPDEEVSGWLQASDVDGPSWTAWSGAANGIYGEFSLSEWGNWAYTVDNSRAATQALEAGQTVTETFVATASDAYGKASRRRSSLRSSALTTHRHPDAAGSTVASAMHSLL